MMRKTDRHFRYLLRLAAPTMRLYTEMITTGAVRHGNRRQLLAYNAAEHPLALQLGGSDAQDLAYCTRVALEYGYDEVNLNCGCPSDRVQSGHFGACLMREPERVADAVSAMTEAAAGTIPITVKTRLGVDDLYDYAYLRDFVTRIVAAGSCAIHVHARRAWLNGLSPRENREIPPLEYGWVYRLKRELPDAVIVINGGIDTVAAAARHLQHTDGIMLGRHAYAHPADMLRFARVSDGAPPGAAADEVELARRYLDYAAIQCAAGAAPAHLVRHLLNLFQGRPGAKRWRRELTTASATPDSTLARVGAALERQAEALADAAQSSRVA